MKFAHSTVILIAATILSLPGCGKRDRDEAKKTGDGTETFKYVPRDPSKFMKKSPAESEPRPSAKPEEQNPRPANEQKESVRDRR